MGILKAIKSWFLRGSSTSILETYANLIRAGCSEGETQAMTCPRCGGRLKISFSREGGNCSLTCPAGPFHCYRAFRVDSPPVWWTSHASDGWFSDAQRPT